jgi:hypothetical protein
MLSRILASAIRIQNKLLPCIQARYETTDESQNQESSAQLSVLIKM